MRIIAGVYKGRKIQAVPGRVTRPTTDRVREAWASTLASLVASSSFDGLKVLDAFAGSGALGLELLSRGAVTCLFIERDRKALATLRANIETLGLVGTTAQVAATDTLSPRLPDNIRTRSPFDLVVLDPPYDLAPEKVRELLDTLAKAQLLTTQSLISYEHANSADAHRADMDGCFLGLSEKPLKLSLEKSRIYGTIKLDYYCCTY